VLNAFAFVIEQRWLRAVKRFATAAQGVVEFACLTDPLFSHGTF
jgi:hypothetical protein